MALFVSDTHLGSEACRGDELLLFLERHATERTLYLVGDIVDDQQLERWPSSHLMVLIAMLRFKEIFYLPGNHDCWAREYFGSYENVTVADEVVILTRGRRYLVVHGDRFDRAIKLVHALGPVVGLVRSLTNVFERAHTALAGPGSKFVNKIVQHVIDRGLDGVVCGHSHAPMVAKVLGVEYINCGDWVRTCTGVVEREGKFTLTGVRS